MNRLLEAKWPNGFSCPNCGSKQAYFITTRRLYECVCCRHQTSLTVDTVMEGSHTPLVKWFLAIFLVSRVDRGISAARLSSLIKVTYKTAWLILHKIRRAMTMRQEETKLAGIIHVNTLCYGQPRTSSVERHPQQHPIVGAATLTKHLEPSSLKMRLIPLSHLSGLVVRNYVADAFISEAACPVGAEEITCFTTRYKEKSLKRILPVFTRMSRWLNRTFHGIGRKHLQAYMDEYCCRFNLRQSRQQTNVFESLLHLCGTQRRITYTSLIAKKAYKFPSLSNNHHAEILSPALQSIRQFVTHHNAARFLALPNRYVNMVNPYMARLLAKLRRVMNPPA